MSTDYLKRILTSKVYDVATESPLEFAPQISARTNNNFFLKREDTQAVFSFKLRGAYNKMANLSQAELKRGVICRLGRQPCPRRCPVGAQAGLPGGYRHAHHHARKSRSMPYRPLGGEMVLLGRYYSDAYLHAQSTARKQKNSRFVHPFDDPDVIAGQGTIGMEILRQHPRPHRRDFRRPSAAAG